MCLADSACRANLGFRCVFSGGAMNCLFLQLSDSVGSFQVGGFLVFFGVMGVCRSARTILGLTMFRSSFLCGSRGEG